MIFVCMFVFMYVYACMCSTKYESDLGVCYMEISTLKAEFDEMSNANKKLLEREKSTMYVYIITINNKVYIKYNIIMLLIHM